MNIVILNASPRKEGNTAAVLRQMQQYLPSTANVDWVDVCSLHVGGCLARDGCQATGHCIMADDIEAVLQKIDKADVLLFGTPVYWWGMSAQLKAVIDKFYSRDALYKTTPKTIGVVVVGANGLKNPQYRLIREQFACIADYLHWQLAFYAPFSASAPGQVTAQPKFDTTCRDACNKLLP